MDYKMSPITPRVAVTGSILLAEVKSLTRQFVGTVHEEWPMILQYQDHFGQRQFYGELITQSASRLDQAFTQACMVTKALDRGVYETIIVPTVFEVMQQTQYLHLSGQKSWDRVVERIVREHISQVDEKVREFNENVTETIYRRNDQKLGYGLG